MGWPGFWSGCFNSSACRMLQIVLLCFLMTGVCVAGSDAGQVRSNSNHTHSLGQWPELYGVHELEPPEFFATPKQSFSWDPEPSLQGGTILARQVTPVTGYPWGAVRWKLPAEPWHGLRVKLSGYLITQGIRLPEAGSGLFVRVVTAAGQTLVLDNMLNRRRRGGEGWTKVVVDVPPWEDDSKAQACPGRAFIHIGFYLLGPHGNVNLGGWASLKLEVVGADVPTTISWTGSGGPGIWLSANNLSGSIPPTLGSATTLDSVNVSYNSLTGAIPGVGIFQYLNASYFVGNPGLCGGAHSGLPPCTSSSSAEPEVPPTGGGHGQHKKVVWLVAAIFGVAAVLLLLGVLCFLRQYRWYNLGSAFRQEFDHLKAEAWPWKLTAFQKVGFTAAEIVDCLQEVNVVGKGGAGTVYKGEMQSGEVVAVKKLVGSRKSLSPLADHGFSAEVDLLGTIRHRNIVRLLAYCSNNETELLVYDYMPNGSLGEVLHGGGSSSAASDHLLADWVTRYRIAAGVAQGLCYLHHDSNPQIVHRDIKSNNILLDSQMEACVADFGVAKLLLQSGNKETMSVIAGSYGYIAPEYAYTMKVDEKSDIYSFGVVLLELLTGRRPAEPEFGDSQDIVQWVSGKLRNRGGLAEVLDPNFGASGSSVQEEMLMVLRIALRCTSRYPDDRPSMRDVVIMLAEAEPRRKGSFKNPLWSTPHRSPLL